MALEVGLCQAFHCCLRKGPCSAGLSLNLSFFIFEMEILGLD